MTELTERGQVAQQGGDNTAWALVLSRIDALSALVREMRGDLKETTKETRDRMQELELIVKGHSTTLEALERANILERVSKLEEAMGELKGLKQAAMGQVVGLIVLGALVSWALLVK